MGFFGGAKATSGVFSDCYTRSEIPGRQIVESLGLVEYTQKGIAGDMPEAITDIFFGLLEAVQEKGGNAAVNVRLITGSYQRQGSGWTETYVVAYGDAVKAVPMGSA